MDHGFTTLLDAVNASDFPAVKYLVTVANVALDQGSPLAVAVSKRKTEIGSYLIHHGANSNKSDFFGTSALHYAARTNNLVNMKELLKSGAQANTRDKSGVTPLHLASLYGWPKCVALLLKAGASPHQATTLGVYPVDLCLASLLRRTQGLFTASTDVNDMKRYAFNERQMVKNGVTDHQVFTHKQLLAS